MLSTRLSKLIAVGALTVGTVRCAGTVTPGGVGGDGGKDDGGHTVGHVDATADAPKSFGDSGHRLDGGSTPGHGKDAEGDVAPGHDKDGGTTPGHDAEGDVMPGHDKDGGTDAHDAGADSPTSRSEASVYLDAGVYRGDGSFFVDGGAYPDATSHNRADAAIDASTGDATSGCTALAACCPSLSGASQSLCTDVVGQGNGASCSMALAQLEDAGSCNGVSTLVAYIQLPPNELLSDGTTLFFTDGQQASGLQAVPVGGGAVTTLVSGNLHLVAVDDVNVYILENESFVRIPKEGAAPTLLSEAGNAVLEATTLGTTAYWIELPPSHPGTTAKLALRSAPMLGGPATTLAQIPQQGPNEGAGLGVTSSTAFVSTFSSLAYFPLTGTLPSPLPTIPDAYCGSLASDTDAVYCDVGTGSNLRIASNATTTVLGASVESSGSEGSPYIVFDDTYAYWVDNATAGTIMKAPKAGGGTATIVARDTSPIALAVDATYVYWSDEAGNIERIAK